MLYHFVLPLSEHHFAYVGMVAGDCDGSVFNELDRIGLDPFQCYLTPAIHGSMSYALKIGADELCIEEGMPKPIFTFCHSDDDIDDIMDDSELMDAVDDFMTFNDESRYWFQFQSERALRPTSPKHEFNAAKMLAAVTNKQ